MRVGVLQHAQAESISNSKRAPSTTRTSLRLESTTCGYLQTAILAIVIRPPRSRNQLRTFSSIAFRGTGEWKSSVIRGGWCV
jgi:hypothetical protein